jgi:hypothetical protein
LSQRFIVRINSIWPPASPDLAGLGTRHRSLPKSHRSPGRRPTGAAGVTDIF